MVSILLVSHTAIASSFITVVQQIFNTTSVNVYAVEVVNDGYIDEYTQQVAVIIKQQRSLSNQVLILSDMFGATPHNIAYRFVEQNIVELISGLNLTMLLRAIAYRDGTLAECVAKVLEGNIISVLHLKNYN
jgi:mannose PTS system EIIA component